MSTNKLTAVSYLQVGPRIIDGGRPGTCRKKKKESATSRALQNKKKEKEKGRGTSTVRSSWIYSLRKEELAEVNGELGFDRTGTVDEMREALVALMGTPDVKLETAKRFEDLEKKCIVRVALLQLPEATNPPRGSRRPIVDRLWTKCGGLDFLKEVGDSLSLTGITIQVREETRIHPKHPTKLVHTDRNPKDPAEIVSLTTRNRKDGVTSAH
uniref:Uncharacterized protein n=1 Tax=Glossina pallidipes TaxID=7398 RepID=A0A1A9Z8U3_GLOPL